MHCSLLRWGDTLIHRWVFASHFSLLWVGQPNIFKQFRKYCSGQELLGCDGQGTLEAALSEMTLCWSQGTAYLPQRDREHTISRHYRWPAIDSHRTLLRPVYFQSNNKELYQGIHSTLYCCSYSDLFIEDKAWKKRGRTLVKSILTQSFWVLACTVINNIRIQKNPVNLLWRKKGKEARWP